jgi:hypothetical protein
MANRIKKKKPADKVRKFIPIHQLKDTYPTIWSGEFEDLISNKRMLDDFLAACSIPFTPMTMSGETMMKYLNAFI